MSFVKKLISSVTSLLGMKAPTLPKPVVPAAPAPTRRTDTGANIVIGAPSGDTRVSGGGIPAQRKVDVLGGLGLGGLTF